MTRITGPDCAVMCNLINTHTLSHTLSFQREKPNSSTKILGKGDISKETKGKKEETHTCGVWLSGRLHIEEQSNEGLWLQ